MDESMEQAIQIINARFYKAFESLSLERMEEVWKHSDDMTLSVSRLRTRLFSESCGSKPL
jgi:hypothetical protein